MGEVGWRVGAKLTPTCVLLFPRASCSTLTWLTAPHHPHLQQPRPLSQESLSSRGPGVPLHPLQAWRSHWMEPTLTSHTRTWHLLPSSACARPRAHGTGASRWYVIHILWRPECQCPAQGPHEGVRTGKAASWMLACQHGPLAPELRSAMSLLGLHEWPQRAIWGAVKDGGWT